MLIHALIFVNTLEFYNGSHLCDVANSDNIWTMLRPLPSKFLLIHHTNLDAEQSVYWDRRNVDYEKEHDADSGHEILYRSRL
jgi:hypothetical protein